MQYEVIGVNVGNGLCQLIHLQDGTNHFCIMIDSGPAGALNEVRRYTKDYCGGKEYPDYVIISHADGDHVNGLESMLNEEKSCGQLKKIFWLDYYKLVEKIDRTIRIISPEPSKETARYQKEIRQLAEKRDVDIIGITDPAVIFNNGIRLQILGPTMTYALDKLVAVPFYEAEKKKAAFSRTWEEVIDEEEESEVDNLLSLIVQFQAPDGKIFVFPGDAGSSSFYAISKAITPSPFWLSVPHHGSRRNLNSAWIKYLKPQHCFISWGPDDDDHPHSAIVEGFNSVGSSVFCTGINKCTLISGNIEHGLKAYKKCIVRAGKVVLGDI